MSQALPPANAENLQYLDIQAGIEEAEKGDFASEAQVEALFAKYILNTK
jgi:predicted transcriptional regulator